MWRSWAETCAYCVLPMTGFQCPSAASQVAHHPERSTGSPGGVGDGAIAVLPPVGDLKENSMSCSSWSVNAIGILIGHNFWSNVALFFVIDWVLRTKDDVEKQERNSAVRSSHQDRSRKSNFVSVTLQNCLLKKNCWLPRSIEYLVLYEWTINVLQ